MVSGHILERDLASQTNNDGHFPNDSNARRIFQQPDISLTVISKPERCPKDTSQTRCIQQRTFPRPVKYLK